VVRLLCDWLLAITGHWFGIIARHTYNKNSPAQCEPR
jgi:hypothetical protein